MRAHAAKEEARTNDENNEGSELSSDDEMSTLQHHSDEETEVVEHELATQLDDCMESEEEFELPELAAR